LKFIDLSSEAERSQSVLRVIATTSLAVILVIVAYAAVGSLAKGTGVIGASLVTVEIPPPSVSPVYFKPITILYIAGGLLLYSGLELGKPRLRLMSQTKKTFIKAFSFIVAVVFAYEVGFNFIYWGGQIAADSIRGSLNPDLIANPYPSLVYEFNVVFATKLTTLFMIAGIYAFYFMNRLDQAK
jgi:hypothetical protein